MKSALLTFTLLNLALGTAVFTLYLQGTAHAATPCDPYVAPEDKSVVCQITLGCADSYCKVNANDGTEVCQDCRGTPDTVSIFCSRSSASYSDEWCQWACGTGPDLDDAAYCDARTLVCKCADVPVSVPDVCTPDCRRTVVTHAGAEQLADRGNGVTGCINDAECIVYTSPASYCISGTCHGCPAGTGCCDLS